MKRQKIRKLILLIAMFLFPVTIFYLSPYLIIQGALSGIINGSFIAFCGLFISSVFFGRVFCGYLCPASGIMECSVLVNPKLPKLGWRNNIKYVIWILWITGVIISFLLRSKEITVNFFYMTDHGISISNIYLFIIYYGILILILVPAVVFGKRAFCHYLCWMAPFMVLGSSLGNLLHLKVLRLEAKKDVCNNCHNCDKNCPMGIEVSKKVQLGEMEDTECILCGECVDRCPKKVITYH